MIRWLIIFPAIIIILVVGLSIYLQPNSFFGCSDSPTEHTHCDAADAIVVVSGGDTVARTTAGISLYHQGWAPYLVFSGAAKDTSGPSNAAAMMRQAVEAGVPRAAVLIDELAVNTQENAKNTYSIFNERDFHDVILVTSGYHQRRASLEFNKQTEGVVIRNYPVHDSDWSWFWWLTPRGWWLAGGEVAKIIGFYLGATS